MYYQEGLTQETIAKKLRTSRPAVSLLLAEARKTGVVQIKIKDPEVNNEELAGQFQKRFGLKKCLVIPCGIRQEDVVLKIVASQAARFASRMMKSHTTVGTSWGGSCYEFMQAFPEDTELCNITVVPLVGGSPLLTREFQLIESVREFSEKLRGTPVVLYSPGFVDTIEDKKRYMGSLYMQSVLEKWRTLDFAVIGVGRPPESYEAEPGRVTNLLEEINRYPDKAVSDLCARRINIRGEFIRCNYNDKVIGIEERDLRSSNQVLAVAVGSSKIFSIIGALNSGILDYFATDEETARQVLNVLDSKVIKALQ